MRSADPDGLANWMGNGCFVTAFLTFLMGLLPFLACRYKIETLSFLGPLMVGACIVIVVGARRFKKDCRDPDER